MKKARIRYINDDKREGYAVEILSQEKFNFEWGLDSFYPLVRREGCDENEERNFVHFSLINKIGDLNRMGYKIQFPHEVVEEVSQ